MLTGKRLTRLWQTARYRHLMRSVLVGRPEAGLELDRLLGGQTAAAALALVRLGELNQASSPLARELLASVEMSQGQSGGWRDPAGRLCPMLSALCLRALMTLPGANVLDRPTLGMRDLALDRPAAVPETSRAVMRGLGFLRDLQRPDGRWESELVSGELVTGFVLLQLSRLAAFRHAVAYEAAMSVGQGRSLAVVERKVWASLERRCAAGARGPARATVDRAGVGAGMGIGAQATLGLGPLTSAA